MLRIKALRESHDPPLTQERLAFVAGVSVATVRNAERHGGANASTLRKLATALGVPPGDLFEEVSA